MIAFLRTAALVSATLAVGLIAGLFFAYACSVMPGLARTEDRTMVGAMQSINVAIVNAWFVTVFVGALVLTLGALLLNLGRSPWPWIAAALALYVIGLAITARGNIPLNNALNGAGDVDRITDLAAVRERFEGPWIRLHLARTVACVGAFACLIGALRA